MLETASLWMRAMDVSQCTTLPIGETNSVSANTYCMTASLLLLLLLLSLILSARGIAV